MSGTVSILSPTGQSVRIVNGRVVLSDLGPACGRTRAFMNAVMGNNPSLQAVAALRKVGRREGWTLGRDGANLLLTILESQASRSAAGKTDLKKFLSWGRDKLLAAMDETPAHGPQALPRRISIDLGEGLDGLTIQVEMSDGRRAEYRPKA